MNPFPLHSHWPRKVGLVVKVVVGLKAKKTNRTAREEGHQPSHWLVSALHIESVEGCSSVAEGQEASVVVCS